MPSQIDIAIYETMPDAAIDSLIGSLQKLKADRAAKREADALAAIREIAEAAGLAPDKVAAQFGTARPAPKKHDKAKKAKGSKTKPPKYRDPATGKTWAGTGRQPRWVAAAIENGASLEDFRIVGE